MFARNLEVITTKVQRKMVSDLLSKVSGLSFVDEKNMVGKICPFFEGKKRRIHTLKWLVNFHMENKSLTKSMNI